MTGGGFLIWSDGRIECVDSDGETVGEWWSATLFGELLIAGYPLHADPDARLDGVVDLRIVGPDEVVAHTSGPPPHEHSMGAASTVFLGWYRQEVAS